MITQIIINEDKDFSITNNYGDVEPFNSALKTQLFNIKAMIDFMDSLNGFDESLAKKRLLRNHTRKYWNYLPYNKFIIPNIVVGCLFRIYVEGSKKTTKSKNIF